jgi:hypothetical protein
MDDLVVMQWFFDLDRVTSCFNWPVNATTMADAKRAIDHGVATKAPADEVLAAYRKFAAAVGPTVMASLLQSDDAFNEVNHSGKPTPPASGKVTLYVDPAGRRVLADVPMTHGTFPTFDVA